MNTVLQIIIAAICLFFVWRIYKQLKQNPELLSKANMMKSFGTMGFLALILIAAVFLMVMMLK